MLYLLLLLGLLPAALVVDASESTEDDDTDDSIPALPVVPVLPDPGEAFDPPEVLELYPEGGTIKVSDFRPGSDRLLVNLDSEPVDVAVETRGDDPMLRQGHETGADTITFPGLQDVPLEDIRIAVTDPTVGETVQYQIGEEIALEPADPEQPDLIEHSDTDTGNSPTDPTTADVIAFPDDEAGIDPNDPETPDTLTVQPTALPADTPRPPPI